MRCVLVATILIACQSPRPRSAAIAPRIDAPQAIDAQQGWCPRPARAPRADTTHSFEIDGETRAVRPMREQGFSSELLGLSRDDYARRLHTSLNVEIESGTLTISTQEQWCQDSALGCDSEPNHVAAPSERLLEDQVSHDACIDYAVQIGPAILVGLGNEVRTYLRDDHNRMTHGPRIATPRLEAIDALRDGAVVLQERDGPLWLARWDGTKPELAQRTGVTGRTLALAASNDGRVYAFTNTALVQLDEATLAKRWQLDGEVWAVMTQDVPERVHVLVIERGSTSRVVLHVLDEHGAKLHSTLVFEGTGVIDARLRYVDDGIYVVHVAASRVSVVRRPELRVGQRISTRPAG